MQFDLMTERGHRLVLQGRGYFKSVQAWADAMGVTDSTAWYWINNDPGEINYSRSTHDDQDLLSGLLEGAFRQGEEKGFKRGAAGDYEVPPDLEMHSNGDDLHTVRSVAEPVHSIEEAVQFFDVDTSKYYPDSFETSYYEGPVKTSRTTTEEVNGTERLVSEEVAHKLGYYRLHVDWKRSGARESVQAIVEDALEEKGIALDAPSVKPRTGDVLTAIQIPDLHLGNLIFAEDGSAEWDLEIGSEAFKRALVDLTGRAEERGASSVLLPIGSDAAHVNSSMHQSSNGTQYSHVVPAPLIAKRMNRLYQWAIKYLVRQGFGVHAVGVWGNHDWDIAIAMSDTMAMLFEKWDQVSVDARITPWKLHRHGECLIGCTHGKNKDSHLLKAQDLYEIMADQAGADWHQTKCREWLTGHLHSRDAETVGDYCDHADVTVRICPTLCPPDGWHKRNGYMGALRGAEARHYHAQEGMIGMDHYVPQ